MTDPTAPFGAERRRDALGWFRARTSDGALAEDLTQELAVRWLLAAAAGAEPRHTDAWMRRVARNLVIDSYRRRQTVARHEAPLSDAEPRASSAVPGDGMERIEVAPLLGATFRALPPSLRGVLYLHDVEGVPTADIARRRGSSERVTSTLLSRARKRFRREYVRRLCAGLLDPDEEIFDDVDALGADPLSAPDDVLGAVDARVRGWFDRAAPRWDAYVAGAYEVDLGERLRHLVPWRPDMRVLDAGCGTGYVALMLAPLVEGAIGVDASDRMLREAAGKPGASRVVWRQAPVERLPVADRSLDVVVCHMLLHHVVSPRRALAEVRRALRPGGLVVIVDADRHTEAWARTEMGDVHRGIDRARLRGHLAGLGLTPLDVADAGTSRSGPAFGRDVAFRNFLLVGRAA